MNSSTKRRIDDIVSRLNQISNDLAELAIDAIQDAIHNGESKRPALERSLTRSRVAVEKAARELHGGQAVEMVDEGP